MALAYNASAAARRPPRRQSVEGERNALRAATRCNDGQLAASSRCPPGKCAVEGWLAKFPEILKYGATGLSALLFFFAFLLLRQQNKRDRPSRAMLLMIRKFMYISVGLAVISLVSSTAERLIPAGSVGRDGTVYKVSGKLVKADGKPPYDITIMTQYPPDYPDGTGDIVGLRVWRDPQGRLPILAFCHPDYAVEAVDLNEPAVAAIQGDKVKLKETIKLLRSGSGE